MVMKLFRSRKFTKRILMAVLVLILPAFLLWGVGSLTNRPSSIGRIGRNKVTIDAFHKSRQGVKVQLLFAYFNNYDTLKQLFQNRAVINFMSWERLILLEKIHAKKIKVPNNEVMTFILHHPLFLRNGIFNKEAYTNILRNTLGMDPRQFEELVRENLAISAFRDEILKNVVISDAELLENYKRDHDKFGLSYIYLDNTLFTKDVTVSEEDIRTRYNENKAGYFEPSKVVVEYLEFPYKDAAQKSSITTKIVRLYRELEKEPGKFKMLAETSEARYGTTDAFSAEDVIPGIPYFKGFHDAAFALKKGAISVPLFSSAEKGKAYLIRKLKDIPKRDKSFEEIRESIKEEITNKECVRLASKKANELYEAINDGMLTFENTALKIDRPIQTTEPISSDEYIENIGPAAAIIASAGKADPGDMITPVTVANGAVIARLDRIIPADESEFAKKKDLIRQNLLRFKQMGAMEKWFQKNKGNVELYKKLEEL